MSIQLRARLQYLVLIFGVNLVVYSEIFFDASDDLIKIEKSLDGFGSSVRSHPTILKKHIHLV